MGINLATPTFKCSVLADNSFSTPSVVTNLSYDSDWVFDSSTMVTVCSSLNGANALGCIVQNLKIAYNVPTLQGQMIFTNIGIILLIYFY